VAQRLPKHPAAVHEEIVQEAMLQAHRSPSPGVDEWGWYTGIAKHVISRWLEVEQRRLLAEAGAQGPEAEWSGRSAHQVYEVAEQRRFVRGCLENLPPEEREIVVSHFGEGEKVPEVASRLGINVNTGYTRATNGRRRLKDTVTRYLARHRLKREDLAVPVALAAPLHDEDVVPGADPGPAAGPPGLLPSRTGELLRAASVAGPWLMAAAAALAVLCLRPGQAASEGAIQPETSVLSLAAVPAPRAPAAAETAPPGSLSVPAAPEAPSRAAALAPQPGRPAGRQTDSALHPSKEAAWAASIAALRRRGALREAAAQASAFHRAYPGSVLLPDSMRPLPPER
jgi:RNA polymerase sigma factor (sigma-70 family)